MTAWPWCLGVDWRGAWWPRSALADSSTAIGLAVLAERNLLPTTPGKAC